MDFRRDLGFRVFVCPFWLPLLGLYVGWEVCRGGAVILTWCVYVSSVERLLGGAHLCVRTGSGCAMGPVLFRICLGFLERLRCFVRVLVLDWVGDVSQRRGC